MQNGIPIPQPVQGNVLDTGISFSGVIVWESRPDSWDSDDHRLQPWFEGWVRFTCARCHREHAVDTRLHGRTQLPALVDGAVLCANCQPRQFGDDEIVDYFLQ